MLYIKILNKYYQKQKEKLWKEARERYQNLSEEAKNKRRKKARGRYNFTEEEKRRQYYQERTQKIPSIEEIIIYLTHNKYLVTLNILGQLNLFHGLVLQRWKNSETFYEFKDFFTIKNFLIFFLLPQVTPFLSTYATTRKERCKTYS